MMWPYCDFCGKRCFIPVPVQTPDHIVKAYGGVTIIATCAGGKDREKGRIGYSYDDILQAIASIELKKGENPFVELILNGGDNHDGELARRWRDALHRSQAQVHPLKLIHEAVQAIDSSMSVALTIRFLVGQLMEPGRMKLNIIGFYGIDSIEQLQVLKFLLWGESK